MFEIALTLIALGGAGLIIMRDGRWALGSFLVQWAGVVLASAALDPTGMSNVLRLGRESAVELITALACGSIAWLTLRQIYAPGSQLLGLRPSLPASKQKRQKKRAGDAAGNKIAKSDIENVRALAVVSGTAGAPAVDYLLPVAAVLLGGIAGFAFAGLFSLSSMEADLAVYWVALAGVLALVLDGGRDPVKSISGLMALFNACTLLLYSLTTTVPGVGLLGLMALARLGLMIVLCYGWLLHLRLFGGFKLDE